MTPEQIAEIYASNQFDQKSLAADIREHTTSVTAEAIQRVREGLPTKSDMPNGKIWDAGANEALDQIQTAVNEIVGEG